MDSAQGHYGKPARKSLSIEVGSETACCEKSRTGSGELAFRSALSPTTAEFEFGFKGPAQISARTRLAYGLLKAAIDEARSEPITCSSPANVDAFRRARLSPF